MIYNKQKKKHDFYLSKPFFSQNPKSQTWQVNEQTLISHHWNRITIKTIQTQREREKQVEDYFKKNERWMNGKQGVEEEDRYQC